MPILICVMHASVHTGGAERTLMQPVNPPQVQLSLQRDRYCGPDQSRRLDYLHKTTITAGF